jgi:hypothetical protein
MLISWKELGNMFNEICNTNLIVIEFMKLGNIIENITYSQSNYKRTKFCGVYLYVHLKTGRCYVGSSPDLYQRGSDHKSDLLLGVNLNVPLQRAYNDDPNLIIMRVIVSDREIAYGMEQHILDIFYTINENGLLFNRNPNAKSGIGRIVSAEGRLNMSKAQTGNIVGADRPNARAVLVNDVQYLTLTEASINDHIVPSAMYKRLNSHKYPKYYYLSDIYERQCSIKDILYNSITEYSKICDLNPEIILMRIQNPDPLYDDYHWK